MVGGWVVRGWVVGGMINGYAHIVAKWVILTVFLIAGEVPIGLLENG